MYPWHLLVCGAAKFDLVSAVVRFVREMDERDDVRSSRDVPARVKRLIEVADRKDTPECNYLDDAYWEGECDVPEDIAGLIVFRDLRD